jgi:hypothetical protein
MEKNIQSHAGQLVMIYRACLEASDVVGDEDQTAKNDNCLSRIATSMMPLGGTNSSWLAKRFPPALGALDMDRKKQCWMKRERRVE